MLLTFLKVRLESSHLVFKSLCVFQYSEPAADNVSVHSLELFERFLLSLAMSEKMDEDLDLIVCHPMNCELILICHLTLG